MIGFTHSFPEDPKKVVDTETFNVEGYNVVVRFGKLTFGKKNKFEVSGVVVDQVELRNRGAMNGWGRHGYIEEADIMNAALIQMLNKHNLMICELICSWPIVKVVVQKPSEIHLRKVAERL